MSHENHLLACAIFFLCDAISQHLDRLCSKDFFGELYLSTMPSETTSFMRLEGHKIIQTSYHSCYDEESIERQILVYESGSVLTYFQFKIDTILQHSKPVGHRQNARWPLCQKSWVLVPLFQRRQAERPEFLQW